MSLRRLPIICDVCGADLVLDTDTDLAACPSGCEGVELDFTPSPPLEGVAFLNFGDHCETVDLAALEMMDGTPL